MSASISNLNTAFLGRLYNNTVLRIFLILLVSIAIGCAILKAENPPIDGAAGYDGKPQTFTVQPYVLSAAGKKGALAFAIHYTAGQNTHFIIEPQGACVDHVMVGPLPQGVAPPVPTALSISSFCHEASIDFSSLLKDGFNRVVLDISANPTDYVDHPELMQVYIAPELFGTQALSTLGCIIIFGGFAYAFYLIVLSAGFSAGSCVILVAGFIFYALMLSMRANLSYSNDLPGHISYMRYMIDGWWHPYIYDGWENFHPPLYYMVAGQIFHFFNAPGIIAPLNAIRIFALFLYMTFCFFGARTLCLATQQKGIAFYSGCLLIVFWPMAPIIATRISNDIAVYAAWSVAFYYLARWYENRELSAFQIALAFTGLTIAFKTAGLPMVIVMCATTLYGLYTQRLHWRDALLPRSLLAIGAFILGVLGNCGKFIYLFFTGHGLYAYLSPGAQESHSAAYFLTFYPYDFIVHPAVTFEREPAFLNYFLKTMLYSEQQIDDLKLVPGIMNILLLVLLAVIVFATVITLVRHRNARDSLMPYLFGTFIPPIAPWVFMMLRRYMFCQSFRFVVPMLIPLVVLYVRGLGTLCESPRLKVLYWLGIFAALGLVVISFLLTWYLYGQGRLVS